LDHEVHETARKIRKTASPFVHFALFRGIRDPNATTTMAMSVSNDPLGLLFVSLSLNVDVITREENADLRVLAAQTFTSFICVRKIVMSEKISVFRSPECEVRYRLAYEAALKLWPVPYEELYIPTRFGDTHVIASGPKDVTPLVLLHPAGCGATIWYRNVGALSQRYRTYAVDTISEVNLSRVTRPIKSRQDFADWSVDLFDGLQIEGANIVGNSFGGYVALNTALSLPERVKKVVLISPAASFDPMWPLYQHFTLAYILRNLTGSTRLVLKAYEWIWQGYPKDECIGRLRMITAVEGVMHHGAPTVFTDDELRKIRTPVLLLIGDHEVIYKPEDVFRRATHLVSGLKAEIVPNANHCAEYTAPDVVNEKILNFLVD
jgi:pimeloyl-ACP methyl ester carboxylesterase